ncbi:unnamed protein product [Pseudo-nitzschia multistriata]|uniref:RAP domain-containing protein n=1 Tax=Pseudo-nitzschia multistriata TaxID=183589 RepID=A0A448Z2H7_9STRA|nr:unnamed protein product [Pseudo-nitzschia multistriata]
MLTPAAFLVLTTMMAATSSSTAIVDALVPTTTTAGTTGFTNNLDISAFQSKRVRSRLAAIVAASKDDNDLSSSFPSMPEDIKSVGVNNKSSQRKVRKRRSNKKKIRTIPTRKNSVPKAISSDVGRGDNDSDSLKLHGSIPKLSDIFEGRASLNTVDQDKPEKSIKVVKTKTKKSINEESARSAATTKKSNRNKKVRDTSPAGVAWRAGYKSSKRTQGRIQKAFNEVMPSTHNDSHSRAKLVLDTLLQTPPEFCNSVNLVCALTYSAKALGYQRVGHVGKNIEFRNSLQETFDILHGLVVVHRAEGLFTPRQLCNVVWAIAKHVDRDQDLLLSQGKNEDSDSPQRRLEETIDEIAKQLTTILFNEDNDDSTAIKSTFQQPKIKLGEICMACWAYGKLRPREIPPGWPGPPQMGSVKTQDSIVADWKTEQLGTLNKDSAASNNLGSDDSDDGSKDVSETGLLFDAMGYALCQSVNNNDLDESKLLEDCTWSELANVGWAFASHGRCRSPESEMLLKSVAQEASERLKEDGTIANNGNYQRFLVRDITQLLWSLGTLQSDNFRLADDLVFLVESLTTNLQLGAKKGSSFARGRPLQRWSCADLVQTSVALAHARIDERPLLHAIYSEGIHRLMEGASSNYNASSLTTSLSTKKTTSNRIVPMGEDRRTFHPWETSILLWAQARLYLTEKEGNEFAEFTEDAPLFFLDTLRNNSGSFEKSKIGPQEQANIVWSLVILEKYDSTEAILLIDLIFEEAARHCKENKSMQLEHAHQLWQAYFMLQKDCPEAVRRVPEWFASYLKEKWSLEKARFKLSSARHKSLSSTLELMGVSHINEHEEDIDVAIILQPDAMWVHETDMDKDTSSEAAPNATDHVSVAIEFDGPNHFTRVRTEPQEPSGLPPRPNTPRALGHTVLKYRLLKQQGWTVVRVPYYEFDKIPFWASMERQRYLQRKLKTHANIKFSEVDVSEYKALTPDRKSRYD